MIWENTKLLLGLLYRPVSAMGRIVDEGHWLYAAVVVAALSMLFHATVTSVIYDNYEAVYKQIPRAEEMTEENVEEYLPSPGATLNTSAYSDAELESETAPTFYYEKQPLPLVGQNGWWFVS